MEHFRTYDTHDWNYVYSVDDWKVDLDHDAKPKQTADDGSFNLVDNKTIRPLKRRGDGKVYAVDRILGCIQTHTVQIRDTDSSIEGVEMQIPDDEAKTLHVGTHPQRQYVSSKHSYINLNVYPNSPEAIVKGHGLHQLHKVSSIQNGSSYLTKMETGDSLTIKYTVISEIAQLSEQWDFYKTEYSKTIIIYDENTTLKSLSVKGYPLYPSFNPDILNYTCYIPNGKVMIPDYITRGEMYSVDTTLVKDNRVLLTVKNNITHEEVTYTVNYRVSDATLLGLTVEGYNLTPQFNKDIHEYEVLLPADAKSLELNLDPDFPFGSTHTIDKIDLTNGLLYIITVKSDKNDISEYKVTSRRRPAADTVLLKYTVQEIANAWVDYPVTVKVKADYRYHITDKMTSGTTPDSTTTITLSGDVLTEGDWITDYFHLAKKLVIYCNRYKIKVKLPSCTAETVELRDASQLPADFLGNCKSLKEVHLYQQPWQIGEDVFSNPDSITIRTIGEYVSKYRSFPVWNGIGKILSFDDTDDTDDIDTNLEEQSIKTDIKSVNVQNQKKYYNTMGNPLKKGVKYKGIVIVREGKNTYKEYIKDANQELK